MEVERIEQPPSQPLTAAYIQQSDPRVEALFGGHPNKKEAWAERAAWLSSHAHLRAPASKIAAALLGYNKRIGMSAQTENNLKALADGALTVIGGQQAGLFTGPVMVMHKAISIIQAARSAEQQLGQRVVPVFWIAGEDHDWAEVNRTYIVGSGALRCVEIERDEQPRTSVSRTRITHERLTAALRELANELPDTEFKPSLLDELEEAAGRSGSLSELFGALLGRLFASEGLIVLDADDAELRRLEAPMFERMIEQNEQLEQAYAAASTAIAKMGYPLQAEAQSGCANLFVYRDERLQPGTGRLTGERVLLYRNEDGFADRKQTMILERAELLKVVREAPELLSNNVLTRPIMQDYILPVLATVLGPGEIAYWGQTSEAFRLFGMQMPIIVPRMSFTVVDDRLRKRLEAFDLTVESVRDGLADRRSAWLASRGHLSIAKQFEALEKQFTELYEPLLQSLGTIEQGLATQGASNQARILDQLRYMQGKALEAHERKHEAELRKFDWIEAWLYPNGQPQERVLNYASLWNVYGKRWLDSLLAVPYDQLGGHYIIKL